MILCILQARMRSTRLPGKVMLSLEGKPMLARQIERMKQSKMLDGIVLATTEDPADDVLKGVAEEQGVGFFRGSAHNVLDRYHGAAQKFNASVVVRVTGDCPVIDPQIIDKVIETFLHTNVDYISNWLKPTFPDGLDVEVFSFRTLEHMRQNAKLPSELEHVTRFVLNNQDRFKVMNFSYSQDLSKLRWTVDELDDFIFVSKIYELLFHKNPAFGFSDILAILQKYPELSALNAQYLRDEGLAKSFRNDALFLQGLLKETSL